MPTNKELGERVQKARKALHLTQTELGEMFGTKGNVLSTYERGVRRAPPELIDYLVDVLHINREFFDSGEGSPLTHSPTVHSIIVKVNNMNDCTQEFVNEFLDLILKNSRDKE